jgi:hypothetical protein
MIRSRLAFVTLAAGLGLVSGCLNLSERPLLHPFRTVSSRINGGCCESGCCESGCCGAGMEGPVLDGGPGMPPPPPPPDMTVPMPQPRLVPTPQAPPTPYVPNGQPSAWRRGN